MGKRLLILFLGVLLGLLSVLEDVEGMGRRSKKRWRRPPPPPPPEYSIGGEVKGLVGSGLILQNNGRDNLSISRDGPFRFATRLRWGSNYTITILRQALNPEQNCVITQGMGIVRSEVREIRITCPPPPPPKPTLPPPSQQPLTTVRVSVNPSGGDVWGVSNSPDISGDGRFVVFESGSRDFVAGDNNNKQDIFMRDIQQSKTIRISLSSSGEEANDHSHYPSISSDGRFVAFISGASNLVPNDTNGKRDVFLRDTVAGVTTRLSVSSSGEEANDYSGSVSVSQDGRLVVFESMASNLVSGDTNKSLDIFLRDMQTGTTTRLSLDSSGVEGKSNSYSPSISDDGRFVAFTSYAFLSADALPNRQEIFVRDTLQGTTTLASPRSVKRWVNGRLTQDYGQCFYPAISGDGRFVVFSSNSRNHVDPSGDFRNYHIYLFDRNTGTIKRISNTLSGTQPFYGNSDKPNISRDGRHISFFSHNHQPMDASEKENFGAGIFLHDTQTGKTIRVSVGANGERPLFPPYGDLTRLPIALSVTPTALSSDGRFVGFVTKSPNMVPNDKNGHEDIFLRGPFY